MNRLKALSELGQSPWLDFIQRNLIGPKLDAMVTDDGLGGMTSNPAIFEKAIGHSADYDAQFTELLAAGDKSVIDLYEAMAIKDIQGAADHLRPVYDRTERRDGYISLEVSPYLALDTEGTIAEARRLWKAVDRPNLMVKVPGTTAGIPAIQTLIGEGININVTLLFAQDVYVAVAEAFIAGLEKFAETSDDPGRVNSVASFFISRIDTLIDSELDKKLKSGDGDRTVIEGIKGKIAIANAKLAYQHYKRLFSSSRWQALAAKGAFPQRLLWASTGTKNPAFSDVLYVETLIGDQTVNTMPPATMDAFRDHGTAAITIEDDLPAAEATMKSLAAVGISMDSIAEKLVKDGVQLFADAADSLLGTVAAKRAKFLGDRLTSFSATLPDDLKTKVDAKREEWRAQGKIRRLWAHDATLWTRADEAKWLGWLDIAARGLAELPALKALAEYAKGFDHVLLLGMGGSSLGPEVIAETFGQIPGYPELLVLDSTDPAQIRSFEERIDLAKTLFIVSSKSGSTLEPNIFKQYFFDRASSVLGAEEAGKRFVAVTDPGSHMQHVAEADRFGHVFFGDQGIGGRYSVLSNFGLVPAAAAGIDVGRLLDTTLIATRSCGPDVPPVSNPGVQLGLILGVAGTQGRDKITILAGPGLDDFGAWAEQLLAESTGKQGKGLIPVDAEPLGAPDVYGTDRVFIHVGYTDRADPRPERLQALEQAGHPVIRIGLKDAYQLGQEFFRWEIATAVAGSIIGIDSFDQPDVEASKIATKKLTTAYESKGSLPPEAPFFEADGIKLFADPRNADALRASARELSLEGLLEAHFDQIEPGDYAAFLAYIQRDPATIKTLQAIRLDVRDHKKVATVVGFGPRFLHSTGQAYKGGPNSGVFLQITADNTEDLPVPGQHYSFGIVKEAQARGDFDVLAERGRRALRVHLGADLSVQLDRLAGLIRAAVA
jgi:transaldolase/glucose-6-phosphate isomerase